MVEKKWLSTISLILQKFAFPLFLLIIGGTAVLESMRITKKYPSSNWLAGPSGFMMIVGGILLLLFLIELVKAIKGFSFADVKVVETSAAEETEADAEDRINNRKMVISFLMLVAYVLILKYLGFAVSSVLYLAANLWILKNPPLRTIITVVVILVLLLFGAPQLGISLPRGIFGF